jgi:hypothetical protein
VLSFTYEVDAVWDSGTLLVCLAATYFVSRLHSTFKGGTLGFAYKYYLAAGAVLSAGLAARVVLDLYQVNPSVYGISVRDPAIVLALVLFLMGLRKSSGIWSAGGKTG